jgi:hypothetical protein
MKYPSASQVVSNFYYGSDQARGESAFGRSILPNFVSDDSGGLLPDIGFVIGRAIFSGNAAVNRDRLAASSCLKNFIYCRNELADHISASLIRPPD